jgi:hypothetical protein
MNLCKRLVLLYALLPLAGLQAQQGVEPAPSFYLSATGGISVLLLRHDPYSKAFEKYYFEYNHPSTASPVIVRVDGLLPFSSWVTDYLSIGFYLEDFDIPLIKPMNSFPMPRDSDVFVSHPHTKVMFRYVGVSGGLKYNFSSGQIPSGFSVQLSMNYGIKLKAQQYSTINFINSTGMHYFENLEELKNARSYRLSLRPEVLYDIPVWRFVVTPRIGYDFSLTEIESVRAKFISITSAALSLAYAIR